MNLVFNKQPLSIEGKRRLGPAPTTVQQSKQVIDYRYDLVFRGRMGSRLYVGACEALGATIANLKAINKPFTQIRIRDLDYRRQFRQRQPIPKGRGFLFIDLRDFQENRDTIDRYMKPLLKIHAALVASQLYEGRWVFVNCKLGQNRSAMFVIAVLVVYTRKYYTASLARAALQGSRPNLRLQAWMTKGFQAMGYESPVAELGPPPVDPSQVLQTAPTRPSLRVLVDSGYDLVFEGRLQAPLYVGSRSAQAATKSIFGHRQTATDTFVVKNLNYNNNTGIRRPAIPKGTNPLFIDLQEIAAAAGPATAANYMQPLLQSHAASVARHLYNGRWVFVADEARSSVAYMFAIAVIVEYKRNYYTASDALAELRRGRHQLNPQEWVMEGFRALHFEPPLPPAARRRKRTPTKRLMYS